MATRLAQVMLRCALAGLAVVLAEGAGPAVPGQAEPAGATPVLASVPGGARSSPVPAAATRVPAAANVELTAFKKAIRQLYDLKERAWAAGDAETIVTRFYAPDAISIGEGDPGTMVGREQFRETYRKYVKDVTSVRIESVRTVVNGNAGWDWTNFYATIRPEKANEYPPPLVRVLFLWSREGGHWICKGDVFVNGGFKEPL
jgi:uncharacterized protein (TIGR02246 family)